MAMVDVDGSSHLYIGGFTAQVGWLWLGLGLVVTQALSLHSPNETCELS